MFLHMAIGGGIDMNRVSITDYGLLQAFDDLTGSVSYGCRQKWYSRFLKRFSGCAPTVFSSQVWYLLRRARTLPTVSDGAKAEMKKLMEEVWHYVTPSLRGLPSAAAFAVGASKYMEKTELGIRPVALVIPPCDSERPEFPEVVSFIADSLAEDFPVAFLCLDPGEEKTLDTWHWTVVLSLEYSEDFLSAQAEIMDDGKLLRVDIRNWFATTKREGGFVGFARSLQVSV